MIKKPFRIAFVYDLNPKQGLGHFTRTSRLITEFRKNGIKCFIALEEKHKNFHNKVIKNERPIYFEKTTSSFEAFLEILKKKKIHAVLIDSYSIGFRWERYLREKGLFIVALDDHLKKHSANLVFTNKPETERKYPNSVSQHWYMGPEFSALDKGKGIPIRKNKPMSDILLHAGGSSLFNLMENFTIQTIDFANAYRINLSIICTTDRAKRYIEDLLSKRTLSSKINILPFRKNLENELHSYDVVAGPSGTTTFETILAGSLPFTFQLKNDGRDSISAFNQIGHLMHLSHVEKDNPIIVKECWQLILNKKFSLSSLLSLHSASIDGKGAKRTVEKILLKMTQRDQDPLFPEKRKKKAVANYVSVRSNFSDIRNFLETRNQTSVREVSAKSDHLISWPEHLRWWLNPNIRKYTFKVVGKNVGYFWIKTHSNSKNKFLTSGWFINENNSNKLRLAKELTASKVSKVKRYYSDYLWIIIMRNDNKLAIKLNLDCGFKIARKESQKKAIETFLIDPRDYLVMEMEL